MHTIAASVIFAVLDMELFTLQRTLPQACLTLCVVLSPGFSAATVFGVDDRLRPDARLDEVDEKRYSATQVVSCRRDYARFFVSD